MVLTEERWLTVEEVAERLRLHPETVRRMLRRGELPGKRLLGQWRISEAELRDYMRQGGPDAR